MTEHAAPQWVRQRDGRLAPFDADRVCRALFAATAGTGRPDPFLARELTDSVVHFLADETIGVPPTVAELIDMMVKVVRELGQPELARHLEARDRPRFSSGPRRLAEPDIFPPDIAAAQTYGWLTIAGPEYPTRLAGTLLRRVERPTAPGQGIREALEAAREATGNFVAIDSPEFDLAPMSGDAAALASEYARELRTGLRATGLAAVVNLNIGQPPGGVRDLGDGPLFSNLQRAHDCQRLAGLADALASELQSVGASDLNVAWHLTSNDFDPGARGRLDRMARMAVESPSLDLVFDRPRRPVALGAGLTRRDPAVLLTVGVHLPLLFGRPGGLTSEAFLGKVGTLARLARAAGHARQNFLRAFGGSAITRGFLLDRARLVVVPVGLDFVVGEVARRRLCDGGGGTAFAVQVVRQLRESLAAQRPQTMDVMVDSFRIWDGADARTAAGLTAWDSAALPRQQIRAAGELHAAADAGMATVLSPKSTGVAGEEIVGMISYAWAQTDVRRLRFRRASE